MVKVFGNRLFILDRYHELANVIEREDGQLQHKFGVEFYLQRDYRMHFNIIKVPGVDVYGLYSISTHYIEFFSP